MGRPTTEIDLDSLLDVLDSGITQKEAALQLGVSIPTLQSRIAELEKKSDSLIGWKKIRNLRITELTALILDEISEDKIKEASLGELVKAYKILREKESDKDEDVRLKEGGLVAYLIEVEKKERALQKAHLVPVEQEEDEQDVIDGEFL